MYDYVIGLDGGGTKTLARVVDTVGHPIADAAEGGANLCGAEDAQVYASLAALLRSATEKAGGAQGCKAVALGVAGCSREGVEKRLSAILTQLTPPGTAVCVVSDWEIAVRGTLPPGVGLVINAGTGSFVAGRDAKGQLYRAGGGGHILDDEGCGYSIGRDGLRYLLRTLDGREEPCALTRELAKTFCLHSIHDVVTYAHCGGKAAIAKAAPTVVRQMENGDPVALMICKRGVAELLRLMEAVRRQMRLEAGQVVFIGGMIQHNEAYRTLLTRSLISEYPNWQIGKPAGQAVDGAVELALQSLLPQADKGEDSHRKPTDQDTPEL